MKRIIRLYRLFVAQYLKTLMQSKLNFYIGLVGFLCTQATGIAFLYLIFEQIPALNDWSFEQLLFIYGFAQLPRGLDHMFTDYVWFLSFSLVKRGDFDRYLLRPLNPFFQIVCERFQLDACGELLVGISLVGISIANGTLHLSVIKVLLFIVAVLAGAVIYTAIKLFLSSLAFWIVDSYAILQLGYDMAEFAKYPISIYSKPVRLIVSYVVPFAFVAFFPASYFISDAKLFSTIGIEVIIAVVLWIIAYTTFTVGSNRYESAGN